MHTTLVSACMILKNVSCSIFEHFQAFNLSGPYREWNTGYNERESGFSTERETWFCKVWDILITEGLFLVRALFINSVELNSDVLPTKFCSIMTVLGRRKKKKAGSLVRVISICIYIWREARLTTVVFTLYSLLTSCVIWVLVVFVQF